MNDDIRNDPQWAQFDERMQQNPFQLRGPADGFMTTEEARERLTSRGKKSENEP